MLYESACLLYEFFALGGMSLFPGCAFPPAVRRASRSRAVPAASANAACMAPGRSRGTRLPALAGTKKRARFTSDALESFGFTYV